MPELPEVETVVRHHREMLRGRRITSFDAFWQRTSSPSPAAVRRGVVDRRIVDVTRRGKYIILSLDDGAAALIHLRMSGRLQWDAGGVAPMPPHTRAKFTFGKREFLYFCDARKFGRIVFTKSVATATAALGAEPLDAAFSPQSLAALLSERSRQIKPLLLDQHVIAGIGNIYADESLHAARIHPATRSNRLRAEVIERLHAAIRSVLDEAIQRNGTSFDWVYPSGEMQRHLRAYGRTGEPCDRCETPIRRIVVAQRGTHFCPTCQTKRPKSR